MGKSIKKSGPFGIPFGPESLPEFLGGGKVFKKKLADLKNKAKQNEKKAAAKLKQVRKNQKKVPKSGAINAGLSIKKGK